MSWLPVRGGGAPVAVRWSLYLHDPLVPYSQCKQHYLQGTRKEALTNWWLQLIEDRVDKYLVETGRYHQHAVPYNYLDQPPVSMQSIQENLRLVHDLLGQDPQQALKQSCVC